jgi:hypothetical protein
MRLLQAGGLTLCHGSCCNFQAYPFVDRGNSSKWQVYYLAPLRRLVPSVCTVWQRVLVSPGALHRFRPAP